MYLKPEKQCALCPRLVQFRLENRSLWPHSHNLPVESFGTLDAKLLIVGLAPGRRGANATGRPFTGDYAGLLLYKMLEKYGFSKGKYNLRIDDGLELVETRITNAVRCAVPDNKANSDEVKKCRQFLQAEIREIKKLKVILTLGKVAHDSVIKCFEQKINSYPFAHGAVYVLEDQQIKILSCYHCSRYNVHTKRLSEAMFDDVFRKLRSLI